MSPVVKYFVLPQALLVAALVVAVKTVHQFWTPLEYVLLTLLVMALGVLRYLFHFQNKSNGNKTRD